MGLIFSTLKQEMRKMFKKKHNLFLQWSSLGILGCNLQMQILVSQTHLVFNSFIKVCTGNSCIVARLGKPGEDLGIIEGLFSVRKYFTYMLSRNKCL